MKYLLIVWLALAGGAFYFYKHMPKHQTEVIPAGVDEMQWRKGRAIYRARCISCHNVDPSLHGTVGPALRGVSEELLTERLTYGKGAMPIQKESLRFVPALREYLK
jgi:mono/diheme cytochrome c family protein